MSENAEPMFEDISGKPDGANENVDETLKAYREALEQEWETQNDPTNLRQTAKQTKEAIAAKVPDYLANMRSLAMGAISESVRYQANKYLLDAALLPGGAGAKDTLGELLEEMNAASETDDKEKKGVSTE